MTRARQRAAICAGAIIFLAAGVSAAQSWRGRADLEVRVSSRKGGDLSGARVELKYRGGRGGLGPPPVATDGKGRAIILGLAAGTWQVEVKHPEFMSFVAVVRLDAREKPQITASFLEASSRSSAPIRVKLMKARGGAASPPLPVAAVPPPTKRLEPALAPAPEPEPAAPSTPQPATAEPERHATPTVPTVPPAATVEMAPSAPEAQTDTPEPVPASTPEPATAMPPAKPVTMSDPPVQAEPEPAVTAEKAPAPDPIPTPEPKVPMPEPMPEPVAPPVLPVPAPAVEQSEPQPLPEPEPAPPEPSIEQPAALPPPTAPAPSPEPMPQPEPQREAPTEAMPVSAPTVEAPAPTIAAPAPAPPPPPPPAPEPTWRSYRQRTCPECRPGEWAVAVAANLQGTGPCTEESLDAAASGLRRLGGRGELELAAFAGAVDRAVGIVRGDASSEIAAQLATARRGGCQVLGIALPKGGRFVGFQYEHESPSGRQPCLPDQGCPGGRATFMGPPRITRGVAATVVHALAFGDDGMALMTVFFRAPNDQWAPQP